MDLAAIQSILLTAFIGIVIGYAKYVHNLKERVSVLEKTVVDMRDEMLTVTGNIMKTIDGIQKRQDEHSKKQDDILDKMGSMEKEILGKMGDMAVNMSSLASDLKNLTNLIAISDAGIKIKREQ